MKPLSTWEMYHQSNFFSLEGLLLTLTGGLDGNFCQVSTCLNVTGCFNLQALSAWEW